MAQDRAVNRLFPLVFGVFALGLAAATLRTDPGQAMSASALGRMLQAASAVVVLVLASVGGGAAALSHFDRSSSPPESQPHVQGGVGWLEAMVTGWLLWGLLSLPLALLGGWTPWTAWLPGLVLVVGWVRRPTVRWPRPHAITLALAAGLLFVGVIDALAPAIDTDELYQHLALPDRFLRAGHLLGGVLHPDGSRPQLLSMLYSPLLAVGTDSAPRLFSTGCALALLLGIDDLLQRIVPEDTPLALPLTGSIFVGSYTVLHEVGLAANNLPTAVAVLATTTVALRSRPLALAACAGAALSFKYTAAGAMVGIWLVAPLPWKVRLGAGIGALCLVSPWWVRNLLDGLHPLFPYAGWGALPTGAPPGELTFQYLEKYGAGRTWLDFLRLPLNAVLTAEVGSFRFLGRLSPVVLLLALPALWGALRDASVRRLAVISTVAAVAWAAGPHWLRHLLPILPVAAATLGAGTALVCRARPRWTLAVAGLVFLAGLPSNWGPVLTHLADRAPVALGQEERSAYLDRTVRSANAVHWLNRNLPEDATVAILFEWPTHYIHRTTVLGSVEDHVPARYWMLVHGDDALRALQRRGVTHLVVGRFRFLRKWYPFLTDDTFEAMFRAPVDQLESLLLSEATLVYEANHTRVYRLEANPP